MARKRKPVPSYLKHPNGKARAVWTDAAGVRQYRMLPGDSGSKESKEAFAKIQLEAAAAPVAQSSGDLSVNEMLLGYSDHAQRHYRDVDGNPTNEFLSVKIVTRHVRLLYGDTPATDFGPLALKAVRQKFIELDWCRRTVNQNIERLRRIFKWAVAEELIPAANYHALATVDGLRRGRCDAPDTEPIKPVEAAVVDATLPFLGRHVRMMVELQRVTVMRPGEVCRMRLVDIDRTDSPWVYRPSRHKTQHLGKSRTVMIGPKGKAAIEAFIAGGTIVDPSGPLFSPRRMREERFAEMRAKRKTKVQPSQVDRRESNPDPRKLPAEQYTPNAYALAVRRAAKRAGVPHWHPNQLRHSFGTLAREQHGLEAAQHLLGHSRSDVTERYARTSECRGTTRPSGPLVGGRTSCSSRTRSAGSRLKAWSRSTHGSARSGRRCPASSLATGPAIWSRSATSVTRWTACMPAT